MVNEQLNVGPEFQNPLEAEFRRWQEVDMKVDSLMLPNHPRYAEYREIAEQAMHIMDRAALPMKMQAGYPIVLEEAKKLNELYDRAVGIRDEMAMARNREAFGVAPGNEFAIGAERMRDELLSPLDPKLSKPISQMVTPALLGLGVSRADVKANRNVPNNFYRFANGNVNFDKVFDAEKKVAELRRAAVTMPQLGVLADQMEQGLRNLESTEPASRVANNRFVKDFFGSQTDTRPLRYIGAAFFGLSTTLGLGQFVFAKGHPVNPVVGLTMLAAMKLANPDFMRGGSFGAINTIAGVGSQGFHNAVTNGFHGFDGVDAFKELGDLERTTNGRLAVKKLFRLNAISDADLATLTDNKNSKLLPLLKGMTPELRAETLHTFANKRDFAERELINSVLMGRI